MTKKSTKKTAKKPKKKKASPGDALPKVRVRMYRQGLGDCFLLTFHVGADEKHMLIDCGTLGGITTGVKMEQVVADIRAVTNTHLDLVVATHEHADHVNGFGRQKAAFKQFAPVGRVWFAWTENPEDQLAKDLVKSSRDLGAALAGASAALDAPGMSDGARAIGRDVRSLLGFFGEDDDAPLGATDFAETVDAALKFVGHDLGVEPRYLMPGEGPLEEDWLPGFRFYVLGPPHDAAALKDCGDDGSAELYHALGGLRAGAAYQRSGQDMTSYARGLGAGQASAAFVREWPFDPRLCYAQDDPRVRQWFGDSYYAAPEAWRNVDEDWLGVASDLALQLDSLTNNTSLVLAIERIADGKVLLFPADAQEGNWLSWHSPAELTWNVGAGRAVTVSDLLARTVFYKVGHHASHNATAKAKGLELMQQESDLTAFIPVDRAVALTRHPQGAWKMPARPLYRRLLEKCQGRVVRSDLGWADDAAHAKNLIDEAEFARMATAEEWKTWKRSQDAATHVTVTDLFVDYLLE
jgi:hypothetical protein